MDLVLGVQLSHCTLYCALCAQSLYHERHYKELLFTDSAHMNCLQYIGDQVTLLIFIITTLYCALLIRLHQQ